MASPAFERSLETVSEIAANFKKDESLYLSPKFHEADARQLFIDKFWDALGWDVYHRNNPNPYEREVRIEKNVMVEGRGKRADYAFYTSPNFAQARFMAEAKKPARNLKNPQDCFQAIRYGWNSNTPLSVLTDFEEFLILDSRYKPNIETAANSILKSFHYTDFTNDEKFSEIYFLFSREAVLENSIEKYVESLGKFKGARKAKLFNTSIIQPIDQEFLKELDEQRLSLARAFKARNQQLDSETLTEITQRTLDRLVFLRFLEDKLVEADSVIDNLGRKSGSAWRDFVAEMPRLNKIYNGTLFKPHALLDNPNFAPDEYAFSILRDWLSHQDSAYDFNLIPIHILGSIYERFLGKTIETTQTTATVVEKPEVRKAGGVYYTPEYIVRYIVENTVGKLIKGKTPEEISELRFADIACGSGSFLLGVFDYLIAYHVNYHSTKTRRARAIKQGLCREAPDGKLQLTIHYKKEILLNNVYGVDLDAQAVEVAQFSLYLKLLEEETTTTKQQFLAGYREQLLPSLSNNIIHGNSLVDYDIMDGLLFEDKKLKTLNPMNYTSVFPEVFKKGGFDAIVGNPPYVRMETFKPIKNYLKKKFYSHDERSDLYTYFIEQANILLNKKGRYGVIVSNKFLRANYGSPLREYLSKNTNVEQVIDFAGLPVFIGATVRTIILITSPKQEGNALPTIYAPPLNISTFTELENGRCSVASAISNLKYEVSNDSLHKEIWNFSGNKLSNLLDSIKSRCTSLKIYCDGKICMGIKSGLTEAFVINSEKQFQILKENPEASEIIKPFLNGRDIRRYYIESKNQFLIYTYHGVNIEKYPAVKRHLEPYKEKLNKRATKQQWYELQQPQLKFAPYMVGPKIIFPDISTITRFSLDLTGAFGSNTTYFIPKNDLYLLALLNSKMGFFYFSQTCAGLEGKGEVYLRFFGQYLEGFPVPKINFENVKEKQKHDKIISLTQKIIENKKQLAEAATDKEKNFFERYCETLDKQIDELVYDLYELTDNEIKIVEGK